MYDILLNHSQFKSKFGQEWNYPEQSHVIHQVSGFPMGFFENRVRTIRGGIWGWQRVGKPVSIFFLGRDMADRDDPPHPPCRENPEYYGLLSISLVARSPYATGGPASFCIRGGICLLLT